MSDKIYETHNAFVFFSYTFYLIRFFYFKVLNMSLSLSTYIIYKKQVFDLPCYHDENPILRRDPLFSVACRNSI